MSSSNKAGILFEEVDEWQDVTLEIVSICNGLDSDNPMYRHLDFHLKDTINAVEIGDIKMDQMFNQGFINLNLILNRPFPLSDEIPLSTIIIKI